MSKPAQGKLGWTLYPGVSPDISDSFKQFQARAAEIVKTAAAPGRVLLLRKTAKEFFMGLPESPQLGTPIVGGDA